jgi:hypothetical protein
MRGGRALPGPGGLSAGRAARAAEEVLGTSADIRKVLFAAVQGPYTIAGVRGNCPGSRSRKVDNKHYLIHR